MLGNERGGVCDGRRYGFRVRAAVVRQKKGATVKAMISVKEVGDDRRVGMGEEIRKAMISVKEVGDGR